MIKHLVKIFRRYQRNERGVAAVEFALVSPILFGLLLGGVEIGRYVLVHQKAEKMVYSVADIISQSADTGVTAADVDAIFGASTEFMNPYDNFDTNGTLFLSSVHKEPLETQKIKWQCNGGGTLVAESRVGDVTNSVPTVLPGNFALEDDDDVIVAEVVYNYQPILTWYQIQNIEIYKSTMFRPRLGALTSAPGC